MTTKRQETFADFKSLLAKLEDGPECTNPACPNAHRVHILAEHITINNLIVAGELTPELSRALASRVAA